MRLSRIIAGLIILAGLAIGSAIDRSFPSTQEVFSRPFLHPGTIGESVPLRTLDVTVTGAHLAERVSNEVAELSSVGVWVVIEAELQARGRAHLPTGWRLHSDSGTVYGGYEDSGARCDLVQTGIVQTCRTAFEVPSGDLGGFTLHIPAGGTAQAVADDVAVITIGDLSQAPVQPAMPLVPAGFGGW